MTLKTSLVISGDSTGATAAVASAEASLGQMEQAARRASAANDQLALSSNRATGQARAGYTQLGQQFQDIAVQLQSGTNIGTIIAQQGGQVATAVQQMGGQLSGLAGFLAGPWGAALTVGAGVLINFGMELFRSSDAAAAAAAGWQDARSEADKLIDSLKRLTGLQKEGIDLDVTRAQIRRNQITDRLMELDNTMARRPKGPNGEAMFSYRELTEAKELRQELLGVNAAIGAGNQELARREALEKKRNQRKPERVRRLRGDGGAAARAEFGEDTASKIANIRDQFSDMPTAVERANKGLRQLDDIASDIERRKLVNGAKLTAEIGTARKAIEESLNKPFNDYLQQQRESAEIDKLLLQGREDEAEALRVILSLKDKQKPLDEQQVKAVLATVQAERQRAMVLRDQRELIQANLDAVYDMRGALEQTFADALRGKFSLNNILSSLGNSWINLTAKRLVEDMFGDTLRALENQATGADKVDAAGTRFASSLDKAGGAAERLVKAFNAAGGSLAPGGSGGNPGRELNNSVIDSWGSLIGEGVAREIQTLLDDEIVVEGRRDKTTTVGRDGTSLIVDMATSVLGQFGIKVPKAVTDIVRSALGRIEKTLPEIMKGAMVGSAAGSLLGEKGSGLGGAIGGAIGQEVGKKVFKKLGDLAGPLGSIVGGLVGSLVGGLFKKTKTGTATVGNVDGRAKVTGTGGNDQQRISGARGLASGALDALDQIIEQLGGNLGSFSASIGIRDKKFVLDPTGRGRTKGSGTQKFESEAEAQAALLADIIRDGAVQGLSAAVERALKSSSDVQRGLREALKVQEVELLIGGLGAQIAKQMKDFERQAAERVRIAREYGFDLVKLEERNAKDRLKLTEKLLNDQVGSLQNLIDEMTSGSLFEGSSVDRRNALLGQISAAKAAADAGEEGAADRLAQLLEQLNAVSRDAFGTTGGFAADRSTILDAARDTIARANQRITDAQRASDPALAETNAALDENNGQNAQMIALLGDMNARLTQIRQAGGFAGDTLADLARTN